MTKDMFFAFAFVFSFVLAFVFVLAFLSVIPLRGICFSGYQTNPLPRLLPTASYAKQNDSDWNMGKGIKR